MTRNQILATIASAILLHRGLRALSIHQRIRARIQETRNR